ncbi:MAG TPA: RagB/SusD family nutrient uptake outer membrane protein [Bacteroidales bacterium]|nr:RagB/SusD family nutrient uptake outer membrane protein [Bacteroidales bacterium]
MKKILYVVAIASLSILGFASCSESFFDTEYTSYLSSDKAAELVKEDPSFLDSYINGEYSWLVRYNISGGGAHDDFGHMSVGLSMDMMGEDISINAHHWFGYDYEHDNHEFNYRRTLADWMTYYTVIDKANEIIDFFSPEEDPTTAAARGYLGQAYALRGFAYYYLIQLYQHPVTSSGAPNLDAKGIPLVYASRDEVDADTQDERSGRNTVAMIYDQIESDLEKAVALLDPSDNQVYVRPAKIYIDKNVAYGLQARFYLLSQQWDKAITAARNAYAGYPLMGEAGLKDGFMHINNSEWMWGFEHSTETQTTYASFFSHISNITGGYGGLAYSAKLVDRRLYDQIPATDYRKVHFNGPEGDASQESAGAKLPYANVKFGWVAGWVMDYVYMRAAEMYLIEAEALAHKGDNSGAANALKTLMANRDPSWNKSSVSVDDVYLQRRIELWGEGFNGYDLKRLNKGIDRNYEGTNHLAGFRIVVPPLARTWIYQIPNREMQENPKITDEDQNE